jgi:hypothetical protein
MTIFDKWKTYERVVIPAEASVSQREECRRAFYAGAWAAFGLVMAAVAPENEDACEENLQALEDEIKSITNDLRADGR